jgi:hypothetical protein
MGSAKNIMFAERDEKTFGLLKIIRSRISGRRLPCGPHPSSFPKTSLQKAA